MNATDSVETWKEVSLSSLPLEILEHIFSFLHRDDLLLAMSVCTSWQSLISSSPNLWRSQTFIFDCALRSSKKKIVDMLFCAQTFGPRFEKLSVKCRHHDVHECKKMAEKLNLFLAGFIAPTLSSFKVSDLRMYNASRIVVKKICNKLTQMFARDCHLKVFEMPIAHWSNLEGQKVLDAVFRKSRNTLETLSIPEYFICQTGIPVEKDWFANGLTSLTKLTKLSITVFYLTDELIVSLAHSRRGELSHLTLWANWVFPRSPHVQQDSWKNLTEACPSMEVEFRIIGYVTDPHASLPPLFDSVLPVTKMKILVSQKYCPLPWPLQKMEIVLEHIRQHYWFRLKSLNLSVFNTKKKDFDQTLIKLVKDCPRLINVKILASYHSGDTAKTIERIVTQRRRTHLTSKGGPTKKLRIDSQPLDKASQTEDPMKRPPGHQETSP
ncbi:F-box only protein 39 [Biomphalaria glabrata]|nr:F-box only protein 39 [Biomphalaria glabrata]